ncbi:hypothetical protein YC2023_039548 [Brassica napus]
MEPALANSNARRFNPNFLNKKPYLQIQHIAHDSVTINVLLEACMHKVTEESAKRGAVWSEKWPE